MPRRKKYKIKNIKAFVLVIIILILIINFLFGIFTIRKPDNKISDENNKVELKKKKEKEQLKLKQKKYNDCLNNFDINNLDLENSISDLNNLLSSKGIGFKYQELSYDFSLAYNSDVSYYGASLIKLVDALYLIDNDVDLNITKTYTSKYNLAYSSFLSKHNYGDEISLRDLMKYAVMVSDNGAHMMLINHIGFTNLQNYGQGLGGKVILTGGDNFGNQTADDMIIYLNKAYELINSKENGAILKEAMLNTEVNYLNFDDVVFGHKYGSYDKFYHDVGIYFGDKPYLIAVLTRSDSNKEIVTEVSKKVYKLHNEIEIKKDEYCREYAGV